MTNLEQDLNKCKALEKIADSLLSILRNWSSYSLLDAISQLEDDYSSYDFSKLRKKLEEPEVFSSFVPFISLIITNPLIKRIQYHTWKHQQEQKLSDFQKYLEVEQQRAVRRYEELRQERNISHFHRELDAFRQEHDLACRKYETFLAKLRLPEVFMLS